jgi:hypothetical protein
MVLLYALGGGLGHLTRARCVIGALGLDGEAAILSASRYARDPRVTGGVPVIEVPRRLGRDRAGFRRWMAATLREVAPHELIVDSFPGGILGELCGMELPPSRLVARHLRWPAYRGRLAGPVPHYDTAFVIEPLAAPHRDALDTIAQRLEPLALTPSAAQSAGPTEPLHAGPHVVVVHSGPADELEELIDLAHEHRPATSVAVLVVSPDRPSRLPAGTVWRNVYPIAPHLRHAELTVTAAGWGAMHDTAHVRDRHRFVPFPRPLDDQFARARAARRAGREQDPTAVAATL